MYVHVAYVCMTLLDCDLHAHVPLSVEWYS